MSDIVAVMDEYAAGQVFAVAETKLGTVTNGGSSAFGPFTASYSASGSFSGGTLKLIPSNIVQITRCSLNYKVHFNLSFDLSNIIPDVHIGGKTIRITRWIRIRIPGLHINWPNVNIPVTFLSSALFTSNFALHPHYAAPNWRVDIVIMSVPGLQLAPAASAVLALIGAAAAPALMAVPLIGGFLGAAVLGITNTIGIAGVTNLLGLMLTPLVSGTTFTLYDQPRHFPLLPAVPPLDPPVFINLDQLTALIISGGEPELLLSFDVSAP
ncbi:MAG TPA: hypothetical protein VF006_04680 [Longimicrobium sp.]